MKVVSKLVNLDLQLSQIERHKNGLVVSSDPEKSLATKIYLTPEDIGEILKMMLKNPPVLLYLVAFPFHYLRAKQPTKQDP